MLGHDDERCWQGEWRPIGGRKVRAVEVGAGGFGVPTASLRMTSFVGGLSGGQLVAERCTRLR